MSDSSRPHGLQPSRLLCPWDFPGTSTGVGCHCLLRRCVRFGMLSIARNEKPYSQLLNSRKLVRRFPSWLIQEHSRDPEQPACFPLLLYHPQLFGVCFQNGSCYGCKISTVVLLCFCLSVRKPFPEHPEQPSFQS